MVLVHDTLSQWSQRLGPWIWQLEQGQRGGDKAMTPRNPTLPSLLKLNAVLFLSCFPFSFSCLSFLFLLRPPFSLPLLSSSCLLSLPSPFSTSFPSSFLPCPSSFFLVSLSVLFLPLSSWPQPLFPFSWPTWSCMHALPLSPGPFPPQSAHTNPG